MHKGGGDPASPPTIIFGFPLRQQSREIMDLDLNCSPPSPSPDPAPQDHHLQRAMLRQENTYRHQVKDLHRMYWAQKNIRDVPFWKQSAHAMYAQHSMDASSSHMMDFHGSESHPDALGASYEIRKQALRSHDGAAEYLGARGSIRKKPDPGGVQGRSDYRCVIDLEKPPSLDDDDDELEIISSARFSNHANHNVVVLDSSQCTHVGSGSTGSNGTLDSYSPVKAKISASGRMLIDLNISQEDDFNVCSDPSKVSSSLLASLTTEHSGKCCNNSSKAFHKGSEASIGSSKGSSITVLTSISAPDSSREVMAAGFYDPQSTSKHLCVQASKHDALLRGNIRQQQTLPEVSAYDPQVCMEIPRGILSVRSSDGNYSLVGEPTVVHREHQKEISTVISDGEMEGFDLNVSVGSIELPSTIVSSSREKHVNDDGSGNSLSSHYFTQNQSQQNVPPVEYPTVRDHQILGIEDGKSVRSPDSGIAVKRSVLIPDTPQGRDYACPRLRLSNPLDTTNMHQTETEEDGKIAATAAETLVSLFIDNCAWTTDSHCSNNQTDVQDGSHEPELSLDSFEEGVMNLEEMKGDGESVPMRAPDKDGPSCGIKLKRGRGMRDFQREILPGLVSLARHEICDDMHAIGYELRKTRSRRIPGDKGSLSTRSRLPRRCSTAWNQ